MPMPVMSGIGHERDRNLLDEVACIALDTPSKVAEHVRATVVGAAQAADRAFAEFGPRRSWPLPTMTGVSPQPKPRSGAAYGTAWALPSGPYVLRSKA